MFSLLPTYKRYISIELPFCLEATHIEKSTTIKKEEENYHVKKTEFQLREVSAFISPASIAPGLGGSEIRQGYSEPYDGDNDDENADEGHSDSSHSDDSSNSGEYSSNSDAEEGEGEPDNGGNSKYQTKESGTSPWGKANLSRKKNTPKFDFVDKSKLSTQPILYVQSSMQDMLIANSSRGTNDTPSGEGKFLSQSPQLRSQLYYRNDLLVRVTAKKRVRRVRNKATGKILREEEMPFETSSENAADKSDSLKKNSSKITSARVVGVVSRELLMRTPSDFCFGAYTTEELHKQEVSSSGAVHKSTLHPHIRETPSGLGASTSIHKPLSNNPIDQKVIHTEIKCLSQFLASKAVELLPYEPGFYPNRTVKEVYGSSEILNGIGSSTSAIEVGGEGAVEQFNFSREDKVTASQVHLINFPNKNAGNMNTSTEKPGGPGQGIQNNKDTNVTAVVLPPPRKKGHLKFLESLHSSPTGLLPSDPVEVSIIARLLQSVPVWAFEALSEQAWRASQQQQQEGQVELKGSVLNFGSYSSNTRKHIINCLTYSTPRGPFQRLRVRHDYNPFILRLNHSSAELESDTKLEEVGANIFSQVISVVAKRRTELGAIIREVFRSPHLQVLLTQLRQQWQRETEENSDDKDTSPNFKKEGEETQKKLKDYVLSEPFFDAAMVTLEKGKLLLRIQLLALKDDPTVRAVVRESLQLHQSHLARSRRLATKEEGEEREDMVRDPSSAPATTVLDYHGGIVELADKISPAGFLNAALLKRVTGRVHTLLLRFLREFVLPQLGEWRRQSSGQTMGTREVAEDPNASEEGDASMEVSVLGEEEEEEEEEEKRGFSD